MQQPSGRERWRGKEVEVEGGVRLGFAIGSPWCAAPLLLL